MKADLGTNWTKVLKKRIQMYEFEVGILDDKPYKEPIVAPLFKEAEGLGSYAGGPVRKKTRVSSDKTIGQILIDNMERLNINLLWEPFKKTNSDILKFTDAFLRLATKRKMSIKRVENLLQAIVRNPILKKEYGNNRSGTADGKGFDRHLIDTGQMFQSIKARVKRV